MAKAKCEYPNCNKFGNIKVLTNGIKVIEACCYCEEHLAEIDENCGDECEGECDECGDDDDSECG